METETKLVNVAQVGPSRWQPRQSFDAGALYELALSIQDQGLINPVLVFAVNGGYELIAGERRTRAVIASHLTTLFPQHSLEDWCERLSKVGLAGMGTEERKALADEELAGIRATIYPGDDTAALHLLAVTENLDREGLTPVEEALAYKGLIDEYGWRQRELAAHVNKSQGYVAQRLALLDLRPVALDALNTRVISVTEARAIAAAPAALQDTITAYVAAKRRDDDDGITTRELEKLTHAVTAFLEPQRWNPNPARVYKPFERNRLRIIRHLIGAGKYDQEQVLKLGNYQYHDILTYSPVSIVNQWPWTHMVCTALGAPELASEDTLLQDAGMSCKSCIKIAGGWWPKIDNSLRQCELFDHPKCKVCSHYIGDADPVVIPLLDYRLSNIAREMGVAKTANGFSYVESRETFYHVATRMLQQEEAVKKAAPAQHVQKIKAYYDYQMTLPQEWRNDLQAHACEKCMYYAPLNQAQELPPCYFALNPWEKERAPRFAALAAKSGQIAPRCEGFRYREFDVNLIAGAGKFPLAGLSSAAERMLHWIGEIASKLSQSEAFWGPLYYIYHDNPPDKNGWKWSRLRDWVLAHWDVFSSGRAAHIFDVIVAESQMVAYATTKPREFPDLTGKTREWIVLMFPFDYYVKYGYMTKNWPEGWPMPWKEASAPE